MYNANMLIYIYIYISLFTALESNIILSVHKAKDGLRYYICFFPLKKSEQPKIVAFNRIVVNYNIHFLFYWRGDQRTGVDSCNTGQKNM